MANLDLFAAGAEPAALASRAVETESAARLAILVALAAEAGSVALAALAMETKSGSGSGLGVKGHFPVSVGAGVHVLGAGFSS